MPVLIWIGTFAATWWFFNSTLFQWQDFYQSKHQQWLKHRDPAKIKEMLGVQVFSTLVGIGQATQLYDSLLVADLRLLSRREILLRLALAPLSWMLVYALMLFVLQVNGWLLIGVGAVGLFIRNRISGYSSLKWMQILFSFALFLVCFESLLRQQSLLVNLETDLSLVFILSDGHPLTVFGLFVFSIALSLSLRMRNWSLIWALFLLISQISPMYSALVWVLGERVADGLLWIWRTRSLVFMKAEIKMFFTVWLSAWVGVFFVVTLCKNGFENIFADSIYLRMLEFWFLLIAAHIAVALLLMIWGHLTAKQKKDYEVSPFVGVSAWLESALFTPTFVEAFQAIVENKILRLEKQRADFNVEEWKAVPRPFQKQWETELENLRNWFKKSKSHLSSRSHLPS